MNTRGLTGLASSRISDTPVAVIYNVLTDNDDGSSENMPVTENLFGSVMPLQPKDVQRLQEGGIELRNGVTILIKSAKEDRPDRVVSNGKTWRVVNWAFVGEYTHCDGVTRGTVVAVCDEILVGAAS